MRSISALPVRRLIRAGVVCAFLAQGSGCGDDDPAAPAGPPPLSDLALSLELTPAAPRISEAVTARIHLAGGNADSILASARISWGWTEQYSFLFDDVGRTELQFQFFAAGDEELHYRIDGNLDGDPPYPLDWYGSLRANVAAPQNSNRPFNGPIFGGPLPVGSFPDGRGPYGHDDLYGNGAEWCADWFGWGYYAESPDTDPRGPDTVLPSIDDFKIFRGDSWYGPYIPPLDAFSIELGGSKRRWAPYHYDAAFLGLRVAQSAVP